jgi:hypothetical protein
LNLEDATYADFGIYITDLAFSEFDFNPDDVAATMIHEAVHAYQEAAARDQPMMDALVTTIDWASKYGNGMEKQASEIVFQNDGGRIIMSPDRWGVEDRNGKLLMAKIFHTL